MASSSVNAGKHLATRILLLQIAVTIVISLLALSVSFEVAYSSAIGGTIGVLGNTYFAFQAFYFSGASRSKQIMKSFYKGEAGKFVITAVLFAAALKFIPDLNAIALLLSFSAVLLTYFASPLLMPSA